MIFYSSSIEIVYPNAFAASAILSPCFCKVNTEAITGPPLVVVSLEMARSKGIGIALH